ncbi:MAG: S-layer homology domain-containing protein, partial [Firmicutes bacterium]|nr:S-layer homology domain-containing protein [Bacillota bacterium]
MNMKRMASLCIVMIVILLTAVTPGFAESVLTSDIGDEYIKAAVERLNALGIIDGMDDGKYHPEAPVTREQLAKILVVTLGLEDSLPTQAETSFKDVDADRWSAGYISAAAAQGLIKGYPDGRFQPEKKVSYAEALTMLIRCLGYADQDLQGPWPENYLTQAEALNITDNLTFSPAESADRGAVAVMTNHTLDAPVREQDSSSEVKTLLSLRQKVDEEGSGQEQDALELTLEKAIEAALQDNPAIEQAQLALEDSKVKYERGEFSIKKVEDSIKDIYGKHSLTYLEQ